MVDSDVRDDDRRVGTTLGGKWKLDRLIGIGGMASVYAASHRNGAVAAIKILHAEYARSAEARTRFMREAYIANKVGPGAAGVLDDDVDDDGAPYLVMELLSGETVDDRADRTGRRLPLLEVLWIASETLATLEVAHSHGIIHRDLKPANIFWTRDRRVKMLDFGIARLHSPTTERTVGGTVFGTLGFMAHEQALGLMDEIDARTDLWAVGAIMFNLLTGEDVHPRGEGNELVTAATAHARSVAEVDPKIPPKVVAIIDRALQFERDARYPSARAMREDILAFAAADELNAGIRSVRFAPPSGAAVDASATTVFPPEEPSSAGFATGMSDDDTLALRELFELIELALLSRAELEARGAERWLAAARLGSFKKLEMAFQRATLALASAHIGLFWNVLPEGFATKQGLLWVASPPLPETPKQMFEGGVRMLGLLPGLALEEFGELVRFIRGDLAPFSDYATFLTSVQLAHVVHRIDPTKPGMPEHPSISVDSTASGSVSAHVPAMLSALETSDPALRAALLTRLERMGEGHEEGIGALVATSGVELAMALLRVLVTLGTEAALQAMLHAERSPHRIVRIGALASLDPGAELLRTELGELFAIDDQAARIDGLIALEAYKITAAAPALALRVKSASFDMLPVVERRQIFSTLGALLPPRAETLAVGILLDARVLSAEAHETSRELACELLGRIATSREARGALLAAAEGEGRATPRVRAAAKAALEATDSRTNRLS